MVAALCITPKLVVLVLPVVGVVPQRVLVGQVTHLTQLHHKEIRVVQLLVVVEAAAQEQVEAVEVQVLLAVMLQVLLVVLLGQAQHLQ